MIDSAPNQVAKTVIVAIGRGNEFPATAKSLSLLAFFVRYIPKMTLRSIYIDILSKSIK
jgi:hypothetical protein